MSNVHKEHDGRDSNSDSAGFDRITNATVSEIRERVSLFREQIGFSKKDLSKAIGRAENYMQQCESGKLELQLDALHQIVLELAKKNPSSGGPNLREFAPPERAYFDCEQSNGALIRRQHNVVAGHVEYRSLQQGFELCPMQAFVINIQQELAKTNDNLHFHLGDEFLVALQGTVKFKKLDSLGKEIETFTLSANPDPNEPDELMWCWFRSHIPHGFQASGDEEAKILSVHVNSHGLRGVGVTVDNEVIQLGPEESNEISYVFEADTYDENRHRGALVTLGLGLKMRELRHQTGQTIADLHRLSGLRRGLLQSIENSTGSPNIPTLVRHAAALGSSFSELVSTADAGFCRGESLDVPDEQYKPRLDHPDSNIECADLIPEGRRLNGTNLYPMLTRIMPTKDPSEIKLSRHPGYELVCVQSGHIQAVVIESIIYSPKDLEEMLLKEYCSDEKNPYPSFSLKQIRNCLEGHVKGGDTGIRYVPLSKGRYLTLNSSFFHGFISFSGEPAYLLTAHYRSESNLSFYRSY